MSIVQLNKTILKISIIGDSFVGKTNLLNRYFQKSFNFDNSNTVGFQFLSKQYQINHYTFKIHFWDTAGAQRFRSMNSLFLKNAAAVILVYDIGNIDSYNSLDYWLAQIGQNLQQKQIEIIILGNKIDLEIRAVDQNEAKARFKELEIEYFEVSAKDDIRVKQSFDYLIEKLCERKMLEGSKILQQETKKGELQQQKQGQQFREKDMIENERKISLVLSNLELRSIRAKSVIQKKNRCCNKS